MRGSLLQLCFAYLRLMPQMPTQQINIIVRSLADDDDDDKTGIVRTLFPDSDQLSMAHFIAVYKILDGILNDTNVDD